MTRKEENTAKSVVVGLTSVAGLHANSKDGDSSPHHMPAPLLLLQQGAADKGPTHFSLYHRHPFYIISLFVKYLVCLCVNFLSVK